MATTPFLTGDALTQARLATLTNEIDAADALRAPLASPTLTGTPLSTTPTAGDNTTKIATTSFVHDNAQGLLEQYDCVSGGLAATFSRGNVPNFSALAAPGSGVLNLVRILLPKGLSVTTIRFFGATSGGSGLTNQWFALFDNSRNKLAITADDTSTAWAANSNKFLTVTGGPFVTTYTGLYYLGILVAGSAPTLAGNGPTTQANVDGAAPIISGTSSTGLTNPASCPSTAGAITSTNRRYYAEVG